MDKKSAYFSVIVPVYNVEAFLPQCIESILEQTFPEFELILVNDGSTDGCGAICDAYKEQDDRVCVIHKVNGGLVSARKAGIQACAGEYVLSVDGDDYIAPELLGEIFEAIKKDSPDIVAYGHTITTEDGIPVQVYKNALSKGYYSEEALKEKRKSLLYDFERENHNTGCISFSLCTKAIKKDLLLPFQMRVPEHFRKGEDMAVTIPLICKAQSMTVISSVGYYYRQRSSSIIHTFDPAETERLSEVLSFLRDSELQIPQENINANMVRMLLGELGKAARSYDNYKAFCTFANTYYRERLQVALNGFYHKKLKMSSKIRVFVVKRKMWFLFWLAMHK